MDFCSNKLLVFILEFFILLALFTLADTLADNVLGSLRNNSSEILCFKRNIYCFANLCALAKFKCIINKNICILIFNFFNNIFTNINFNLFFFRINIAENNIFIVKIFTLCSYNCWRLSCCCAASASNRASGG